MKKRRMLCLLCLVPLLLFSGCSKERFSPEQLQQIRVYDGNEVLLKASWQMPPDKALGYALKTILPIALIVFLFHAAAIIVIFILEYRRRKSPFLRF